MPVELEGKYFSVKNDNLLLSVPLDGRHKISVVLFKMNACQGCERFWPSFRTVEEEYGAYVNFFTLDTVKYKATIRAAMKSTSPITQVPSILFYKGNRPFTKYTGEYNTPSFRSFIDKMTADFYGPPSGQNTGPQEFSDRGHPPGPTGRGFAPPQNFDSRRYGQNLGAPTMSGRPGTRSGYAQLGDRDNDGANQLMSPDVIPHNFPWKGQYKKMEQENVN